jgi:hypothetical protein
VSNKLLHNGPDDSVLQKLSFSLPHSSGLWLHNNYALQPIGVAHNVLICLRTSGNCNPTDILVIYR